MNTTTTTPTQQPEALRMADKLCAESESSIKSVKYSTAKKSAAELRRQHAEIARLTAENEALRAKLSKKPIIGSGRTQYDRLIKAAKNIERSVGSLSSWGRVGPDDSDIAWQEFYALASDVCTLIDSPPSSIEAAHGIGASQ